jgi:hypothetical protein
VGDENEFLAQKNSLQTLFGDVTHEVDTTVAVTPFVVIPTDELEEAAV